MGNETNKESPVLCNAVLGTRAASGFCMLPHGHPGQCRRQRPKRKPVPVDWDAVEKLMRRCKRGQGYVPERHEDKLLDRAIRTDYERYSSLSHRVMEELRAELMGKR